MNKKKINSLNWTEEKTAYCQNGQWHQCRAPCDIDRCHRRIWFGQTLVLGRPSPRRHAVNRIVLCVRCTKRKKCINRILIRKILIIIITLVTVAAVRRNEGTVIKRSAAMEQCLRWGQHLRRRRTIEPTLLCAVPPQWNDALWTFAWTFGKEKYVLNFNNFSINLKRQLTVEFRVLKNKLHIKVAMTKNRLHLATLCF